jgi:hypothetical protein
MGLVLILMLVASMVILGIVEQRRIRKKFEASRARLQRLQRQLPEESEEPVRLSRSSSSIPDAEI